MCGTAWTRGAAAAGMADDLDPAKKMIVVTAHRRESFGAGFEEHLPRRSRGLRSAATYRSSIRCIRIRTYRIRVQPHLGELPNVVLIEPLDYVPFVDLMRRAYLLITDSGGIQEEGPSLGKPILVMREKTERPEAVQAGTVKLVGTG